MEQTNFGGEIKWNELFLALVHIRESRATGTLTISVKGFSERVRFQNGKVVAIEPTPGRGDIESTARRLMALLSLRQGKFDFETTPPRPADMMGFDPAGPMFSWFSSKRANEELRHKLRPYWDHRVARYHNWGRLIDPFLKTFEGTRLQEAVESEGTLSSLTHEAGEGEDRFLVEVYAAYVTRMITFESEATVTVPPTAPEDSEEEGSDPWIGLTVYGDRMEKVLARPAATEPTPLPAAGFGGGGGEGVITDTPGNPEVAAVEPPQAQITRAQKGLDPWPPSSPVPAASEAPSSPPPASEARDRVSTPPLTRKSPTPLSRSQGSMPAVAPRSPTGGLPSPRAAVGLTPPPRPGRRNGLPSPTGVRGGQPGSVGPGTQQGRGGPGGRSFTSPSPRPSSPRKTDAPGRGYSHPGRTTRPPQTSVQVKRPSPPPRKKTPTPVLRLPAEPTPPPASAPKAPASSGVSIEELRVWIRKVEEGIKADNYYSILNLPEDCKKADIQRRKTDWVRKYHPDLFQQRKREIGPDLMARLDAVWRNINSAAAALLDDAKRKEYDIFLDRRRKGLPTDPEQIIRSEELFKQGEKFLKAHKYKEALEAFDKAAELNPVEPDIIAGKAWAEYMVIKSQGTMTYKRRNMLKDDLKSVVANDERNAQARYYLGMLLKDEGRTQEAMGYFQEACRLDPYHIDAKRELHRYRTKGPGGPNKKGGGGLFGFGKR